MSPSGVNDAEDFTWTLITEQLVTSQLWSRAGWYDITYDVGPYGVSIVRRREKGVHRNVT